MDECIGDNFTKNRVGGVESKFYTVGFLDTEFFTLHMEVVEKGPRIYYTKLHII